MADIFNNKKGSKISHAPDFQGRAIQIAFRKYFEYLYLLQTVLFKIVSELLRISKKIDNCDCLHTPANVCYAWGRVAGGTNLKKRWFISMLSLIQKRILTWFLCSLMYKDGINPYDSLQILHFTFSSWIVLYVRSKNPYNLCT